LIHKTQRRLTKISRFCIPLDLHGSPTVTTTMTLLCNSLGRDACLIAALTEATVTAGIRQERGFLATESSDEDVVSTVGCNVETTIDAYVVSCRGSTKETSEKRRHHRFLMMT
jgi:hypothetical protein